MSKESKEKQKYYYFRFHEDFFNDIDIQYLESKPSGCKFLIILLKLYSFATKERGIFKLPTNAAGSLDFEALSYMLKFDTGIVMEAWHYITQLGLIETFIEADYAIIKAPKLEGMIGSSSTDADRKRLEREEQRKRITVGSTSITGESDEPIIEVGLFKNLGITQEEYRKVKDKYTNYQIIIDKASAFKRNGSIRDMSDYEAIMQFAEKEGESYCQSSKTSSENDGEVPKGIYNNVKLSKTEWERIKKKYVEAKKLIDHISTQIHLYDYNMPSHYGFAMKCGREDHWLTVAEKIQKDEAKLEGKRRQEEIERKLDGEAATETAAFYEKKKKELGLETDDEVFEYLQKEIRNKFSIGKQ